SRVAPDSFWSAHETLVGGCFMHATQWFFSFSSSGGTIRVHASSFAGCGHRGWNTQPEGGFAGDGTSPCSTIRCLETDGSAMGTAERSAWVYGMSGCV